VARREAKRVAAMRQALDALAKETEPLRQLDAVRRARDAAEELERAHVKAARDAGCTWAEIGKLYGLTKQGAQQRFREVRRGD